MAAVVFVSGCTQQGNNTTQQNNTTVQQNATNTSSVKTVDVVANQTGPATAHKGDNVTITYKVTNNGNEQVANVKISSQDFEQTVGTLILEKPEHSLRNCTYLQIKRFNRILALMLQFQTRSSLEDLV